MLEYCVCCYYFVTFAIYIRVAIWDNLRVGLLAWSYFMSTVYHVIVIVIVIVNLYSASSGEAPQRPSRPNKTKP